MKLVPFPLHRLRLGEALPFDLHDAGGRPVLAAGQSVDYPVQFDALKRRSPFADEAAMAAWGRRLLPSAEIGPVQPVVSQQWQVLVDQLDDALHAARAGTEWRAQLFAVHVRARALFAQQPDASLYHHVYEAGHSSRKYSCHHALLSLVLAELVAARLGWSAAWTDSLGRAALTMNVALRTLQDQLATGRQPITPAVRAAIDGHASAGAALLEAAGFGDPLCVAVVRQHHDADGEGASLAAQPAERQLARVLRRVDIFTAKISRRATRSPMSPVRAAREACLGAGNRPDEIGAAMLQAVGLYPPGCFVALANGELAIVVARGQRANVPQVAALVSPRGSPLGAPVLRDTGDERYSVASAVLPSTVKVLPPHGRVLALR